MDLNSSLRKLRWREFNVEIFDIVTLIQTLSEGKL
jgi:hypothetical protein